MTTDTAADPRLDIVRRWAAAWGERSWDGVAATFAINGSNQSMMDKPLVGREAIRQRTRLVMEKIGGIHIRLVQLAVIGPALVVAERVDSCLHADGSQSDVPVAGFYEIEDGLIAAKRDYYDRAQLLAAMRLTDSHLPPAS